MSDPTNTRWRTTPARRRRLIACLLMTALGLCVWSESEARTYSVAEVRTKSAKGDWDLTADETLTISRQESYDGRWALEQRALGNGRAATQLLDSSNAVVWENVVGDIALLSSCAPAFAVASRFNFQRPVYNLSIGDKPVYEATSSHADKPSLSRDGTAFGILVGRQDVRIISIRGDDLGYVRVAKPMRLAAVAMANDGEYAAVAERKYMVSDKTWQQQISLYHRQGELIGRIGQDAESNVPLCLALSADNPPLIAVGTDRGVSFWTPEGKAIWSDSAAFAQTLGTIGVPAMYVTDDKRVLAITTSGAPGGTFWAWDARGEREAQLELPSEFDASKDGAAFLGASESAVTLQSYGEILTVGWTNE